MKVAATGEACDFISPYIIDKTH